MERSQSNPEMVNMKAAAARAVAKARRMRADVARRKSESSDAQHLPPKIVAPLPLTPPPADDAHAAAAVMQRPRASLLQAARPGTALAGSKSPKVNCPSSNDTEQSCTGLSKTIAVHFEF